jgi:hypothetical protein
MSKKLPSFIKEKILQMPEYRQGTNKVRVTLKDGRQFSPVYVAWADEVVKVGAGPEIPFNADDVVDVENDI